MRKQPTVHSPLGAFGNFTFPNWTQRVHIRDAQSERSADRQLVAEASAPASPRHEGDGQNGVG